MAGEGQGAQGDPKEIDAMHDDNPWRPYSNQRLLDLFQADAHVPHFSLKHKSILQPQVVGTCIREPWTLQRER